MNEERELNQRRLAFLIDTVKNVAEDYEEKSKSLKEHLGNYLTVDIATEWEKSLMNLVYKFSKQNILTLKQVSIFEEINKRFIKFSNLPFYEKKYGH